MKSLVRIKAVDDELIMEIVIPDVAEKSGSELIEFKELLDVVETLERTLGDAVTVSTWRLS